ncbi:MAG: dethiobiotin synthase [Panacibacter sp.]
MAPQPIFITGTGTEIGKTIVAAIVAEALQADYWKPIQAGNEGGTDALRVKEMISNNQSLIHASAYDLELPASPHIAAKQDHLFIDLDHICTSFSQIQTGNKYVIIEGVGGIMVPLNEHEFVIDLIQKLQARVILVSRNYLGSINHSLLTAALCRQRKLDVAGWFFSDEYMNYEDEIVQWSAFPKIGSVPYVETVSKEFVVGEAAKIKTKLTELLR